MTDKPEIYPYITIERSSVDPEGWGGDVRYYKTIGHARSVKETIEEAYRDSDGETVDIRIYKLEEIT